jgi:hypothetical protein
VLGVYLQISNRKCYLFAGNVLCFRVTVANLCTTVLLCGTNCPYVPFQFDFIFTKEAVVSIMNEEKKCPTDVMFESWAKMH